jgi:ferritin-like metal-binding protein YciE
MPDTLHEQLVKYLTDVHAMEVQALAQMRAAPKLAGDEQLARAFDAHRIETEQHESLIRQRLEAHDASPSKLEDLLGAISGKGFVLFARSQPDTPGKLAAHAFSYEHMELAAYELLARVAAWSGDAETAEVARRIREEENAMAIRLSELWDNAVDASVDDPDDSLNAYLADAHALERQGIELLKHPPDELQGVFDNHRAESERHAELIERQLQIRGGSPSKLKDAALRLGALNWTGFFKAQPDTPAKLAMFAYAFEHLEIGGYEQLTRVARRAGDGETAMVADGILADERAAAEQLFSRFDASLQAAVP